MGRIKRGGKSNETKGIHSSAFGGRSDGCNNNEGERRKNNEIFVELPNDDKR